MNAAAAFVAAGLDNTFEEGLRRGEHSIDSGQAQNKLDQLIAFSQECRPFLRKAMYTEAEKKRRPEGDNTGTAADPEFPGRAFRVGRNGPYRRDQIPPRLRPERSGKGRTPALSVAGTRRPARDPYPGLQTGVSSVVVGSALVRMIFEHQARKDGISRIADFVYGLKKALGPGQHVKASP